MDVFPVVPASARILWLIIPLALLGVGLVVFFTWIGFSSQNSAVMVDAEGLRIRTAMYGRTIPLDQLDVGRATTVDLKQQSDYRPTVRTNGSGMPGFHTGWHRLSNGEKALLVVTARDRVAYIPTYDGYSLLLSVTEPDRLISRLRAAR